MSSQPKPRYRFEDYLVAERECVEEKHEFVAGQVFAMTGASYNHNVTTANLLRRLGNQLESGPCTALANDMRLRIETADACTYPDVVVLCNEPSFHDSRKDVITDATLVAEVLSPSTEGYDRGGKFALYRRLGSPSAVCCAYATSTTRCRSSPRTPPIQGAGSKARFRPPPAH